MTTVSDRLCALGITLPVPAKPVANYVPFTRSGRILHVSGQLSLDASGGIKGTVGVDVDMDRARAAARLCGINLLAQISAATGGDMEQVSQILRLGGFVQAGPDFTAVPEVINACSDLMVDVFGDRGRHARSAVGVYKIPLGFAVEVDAVVELIG